MTQFPAIATDRGRVEGVAADAARERPVRPLPRVVLAAGEHEIVVALDRGCGLGWGIHVTFELPEVGAGPAPSTTFPKPV